MTLFESQTITEMSSIPFMMFSSTYVHETIRQQQKNKQKGPFGTSAGQEMNESMSQSQIGDMYNYNLKFMNSVWGLYNRYAPQAFQKNEEFIHNRC